ncbi:hypothetical protein ABK040_004546 [Willaertia magna]
MLKISNTLICFIIFALTSFLHAAPVTNTKAISFDGSTIVNAVADSQFYNNFVNKSVSISTWFCYDNIALAGQNEALVGALGFSSTGSTAKGFGIYFRRSQSNFPQIGLQYATNYVQGAATFSSITLESKKWYFITLVYIPDETNRRETVDFYINGVYQSKRIHTPPNGNSLRPSLKFDDILTNAIDFRLGGAKNLDSGANAFFYTGALDDTKLYNTALSADYISQQYKAATLDTAEGGLILYYPFEDNLNDVTRSISGKLSGSIAYQPHVLPSPPPANTTTSTKPVTSHKNAANNLSFSILGLLLSIIASVLLF